LQRTRTSDSVLRRSKNDAICSPLRSYFTSPYVQYDSTNIAPCTSVSLSVWCMAVCLSVCLAYGCVIGILVRLRLKKQCPIQTLRNFSPICFSCVADDITQRHKPFQRSLFSIYNHGTSRGGSHANSPLIKLK